MSQASGSHPITIDASSSVPPYEQIRAGFAAAITDHTLAVGAKLPTVRALAEELGLAVNTVAKAYRELESSGLVETRGRAGTVVTAVGDQSRVRIQLQAERLADLSRDLGISADETLRIVAAALKG